MLPPDIEYLNCFRIVSSLNFTQIVLESGIQMFTDRLRTKRNIPNREVKTAGPVDMRLPIGPDDSSNTLWPSTCNVVCIQA